MRNKPWLWSIIGAALAAAVVLGVVALTDDDDAAPTGNPEPGPTIVDPPEESESPDPEPDEESFTAAVYFVGDVPQGPRLFREFQRATGPDAASAAVGAALAGPVDEDYRSLWSIDGALVTGDEDLVTIDLLAGDPAALDRPSGMDDEVANLAVEALMRTAQGALQAGRAPVQFLADGERILEVYGVPVNEPLATSSDDEVLAHVWIDNPGDGATVAAGDQVNGLANSFEATVLWELRQGDTVVEQGFTTAEEAFRMAPYSFELPDVPAGEYLLVVSEDDPSGGEGGGPHTDTRRLVFG